MYVHIPFTEMPHIRGELNGIRSVISNLLAQKKFFFFPSNKKLIEKVDRGEVKERCWLFKTADKDI